jgi:hypothetical protein
MGWTSTYGFPGKRLRAGAVSVAAAAAVIKQAEQVQNHFHDRTGIFRTIILAIN